MFNIQSAFNQIPFNRPFALDIYGSFQVDLKGNVDIIGAMEAHTGFDLPIEQEAIFDAVREALGAFILEQDIETLFSGIRERRGIFRIETNLEINFNGSRFHVDQIEFIGDFQPGDSITIDSDKMTFLLNGQNALHLMEGEFLDFHTGKNTITYRDSETGRTVRMIIQYRDRWV